MPCPVTGSEERALLQAIKDSDPAENDVRFVYADWLLDQGRDQQANFVRWQAMSHRLGGQAPAPLLPEAPAIQAFERSAKKDWLALPKGLLGGFVRGLLVVEMPPPKFFKKSYGVGIESCRQSGFLESIFLDGVSDSHAKRLPEAARDATERLGVFAYKMTRRGVEALADVPRLEHARLRYGSHTLLDAEDLAVVAKLESLRELFLSQLADRVGQGMRHLTSMTGLRWLNLSTPELTDEQFAPVCEMTQLVRLDVMWHRLTDASLNRLKAMKGLRSLSIGDSGLFSLKAFRGLREALPECEIAGLPSEAGG